MRCEVFLSDARDEDVGWVDAMLHHGGHLMAVVEKANLGYDWLDWHRDLEAVLEAAVLLLSLFGHDPFLEETAEACHVECGIGRSIAHDDLSVAREWQFVESLLASCPTRVAAHLVEIDVLHLAVARKDVVESESGVAEPFVEHYIVEFFGHGCCFCLTHCIRLVLDDRDDDCSHQSQSQKDSALLYHNCGDVVILFVIAICSEGSWHC